MGHTGSVSGCRRVLRVDLLALRLETESILRAHETLKRGSLACSEMLAASSVESGAPESSAAAAGGGAGPGGPLLELRYEDITYVCLGLVGGGDPPPIPCGNGIGRLRVLSLAGTFLHTGL